MAAPAPRYVYAIPSLSQTIPNLPALGNLDINQVVLPNTVIDPANLAHAKMVAKKLEATHNKAFTNTIEMYVSTDMSKESAVNPGVTEDMVDAAKLRMLAVEGAHVATQYAPGFMTGIAAILACLETIETDIKITKAIALNQRIVSRNAQNQPTFEPVHKIVPGSGYELAVGLVSIAER